MQARLVMAVLKWSRQLGSPVKKHNSLVSYLSQVFQFEPTLVPNSLLIISGLSYHVIILTGRRYGDSSSSSVGFSGKTLSLSNNVEKLQVGFQENGWYQRAADYQVDCTAKLTKLCRKEKEEIVDVTGTMWPMLTTNNFGLRKVKAWLWSKGNRPERIPLNMKEN